MAFSAPLIAPYWHEPTDPTRPLCADWAALLAYQQQLLAQGEHLTRFSQHYAVIGPHLRHVIEHYQALLLGLAVGVVYYDRRPRDLTLEQQPEAARVAIHHLAESLTKLRPASPQATLSVVLCLPNGEESLIPSTLSRELWFLASHNVHHFALVKALCPDLGLPEDWGKAPATVRHEAGL